MRHPHTILLISIGLVACSTDDGEKKGGNASTWNVSPTNKTTIQLGEHRSGQATYYDFANGDGACSFGPSPDAMNVAALNAPDYANAAWCGACADVTGPNGSVRLRIVDLCPECPSGNLDLSPQAFSQIAAMEAGRVAIDWSFVACDLIGPVTYRYKDGANQWWTAVLVANHRLPIAKFEVSNDGTTFREVPREDYNYFVDTSGFGPDAVTVRITSIDGQTLIDTLPPVQEYLVVEGKAQFQ